MRQFARNITIGLIDGLTIPFALAAGLSAVLVSPRIIFISCLAIIVTYSITMTVGAYMSGRRNEQENNAVKPALTVGVSYAVGGVLSVIAFLMIADVERALRYAAAATLSLLFIAGYFDSTVNGSNGWAGAFRVSLTGAAAAGAAYGVASLFR